jgi:methyl-accepting chemotaxis protein
LKKMSLKLKMVIFTCIPVIALIIITFLSVANIHVIFDNMQQKVKNQNYDAISLVLNADRDIYQAMLSLEKLCNQNLSAADQESNRKDMSDNIKQVSDRMGAAAAKLNCNDQFWSEYKAMKQQTIVEYFADFQTNFAAWTDIAQKLKGDTGEAEFSKAREDINAIGELIDDGTNELIALSKRDKDNLVRILTVFDIAIILIMLLLSNFLIGKISKPIHKLIAATKKMAQGDCDVRVEVKSEDEIGALTKSFNTMAENVREGALAAERIAAGDLDVKLPVRSENDLLNSNLNGMIANIQSLVADINMLAESAIDGQLSVRAEESRHSGDFRKIVAGINRTLEAIVQPFDDGVKVLQKMTVNDLTSQMEPAKYQGMLRQFAEQINSVRSSLLTVQDDFIRISKGDISNLEQIIKVGKLSENDHLIPAGIATMTNIKKLIEEVERISTSAVTGDLKTRGNENQFEGGYRQIITGMNQTLDAIVAPINEASTVLQEMAGGNLGVEVNGDYQGDYAVLTEAVNRTIHSFNETLGEIQDAARQVAAGAEQIAGSSQSLSQAATEQAATVEQINASLNDITNQTKQNALNAGQANELSLSAKEIAVNGNSRMKDMLTAMEEINNSSATISKIIKVIDDIAFQTNILALNAAVEAARAGGHGKGFAVVAEEVRNLAARSAEAAKETTHMIEASIHKVESGTKIAIETADELNRIVDSVGKTAALVGEIACASKEQATGIVQINQGVDQVSQVTQTSTATAQESAAASEELAAQAEFLKSKIGKFRLKNNKQELKSLAQPQKLALATETPRKERKIQLHDKNFGKY